jgi:hypothetical protein
MSTTEKHMYFISIQEVEKNIIDDAILDQKYNIFDLESQIYELTREQKTIEKGRNYIKGFFEKIVKFQRYN